MFCGKEGETQVMGEWIDGYMQRLSRVREQNRIGGGQDRVDLVHQLGKLTAQGADRAYSR